MLVQVLNYHFAIHLELTHHCKSNYRPIYNKNLKKLNAIGNIPYFGKQNKESTSVRGPSLRSEELIHGVGRSSRVL